MPRIATGPLSARDVASIHAFPLSRPRLGAEAELLVGPLRGRAIALGRFQRAQSAIDVAPARSRREVVVRRNVGGPALRVGEGQLLVQLFLASPDALGGVADPMRALNRHVRPLLAALNTLGVAAMYGGRDVILSHGAPIAWIGAAHRVSDRATYLEAIVSVRASFALEAELDLAAGAIAPRHLGRAPRTLEDVLGREVDAESLARRIVDAFVAQADGDCVALDEAASPAATSPLDLDEPPFAAMVEEAIGLIGARYEPEQERVAIGGDLGASEDALVALERALFAAGRDATEEQLGAIVDAQLGPASGALVFGVKSLRSIAKAALHAMRLG
jgi:lipoate-protein ligase A